MSQDLLKKQVCHNFTYHTPSPENVIKLTLLRNLAKEFALTVVQECPSSRERSLAITKIEEAVIWANASITRNQEE